MKRIRPKLKEPSSSGVGDWRHYAFFKRVTSPVAQQPQNLTTATASAARTNDSASSSSIKPASSNLTNRMIDFSLLENKRTKEDIRELWKNAIRQQILLNRMDKQNYMLKAKQEEVLGKRVKLSYSNLGACDDESSITWDLIMTQYKDRKCDLQLLNSAILRVRELHYLRPLQSSQVDNVWKMCALKLQAIATLQAGEQTFSMQTTIMTFLTKNYIDMNSVKALLKCIPKHKRGSVWQFFIKQRMLDGSSLNTESANLSPKQNISYEQLRKQLTSHQHAILIDLGRTFPKHPYFNQNLGSGQLALFNLLKAYSIIDKDVGYCQGLTFLAGIILMHLEEEEAFEVLKYVMFELKAREHYRNDMSGLQVKFYQLTRMIYDSDPELQSFLYQQDVLPSLYAAPWFLTVFASQFPVGFAVRVLDVILLHGIDMLLLFASAIVVDHRNDLIQCTGVEQVMDCFRQVVTKLRSDADVDKYLRKVLEPGSETDRQLLIKYAVEYAKMHQESLIRNDDISKQGRSHQTNSQGQEVKAVDTKPSSIDDECYKLQLDIRMLLKYVENMQDNVRKKFGDELAPVLPPEIQALTVKYFPDSNTAEKKFGNGNNNNNTNNGSSKRRVPVPVQLISSSPISSSIFNVDSDQRSIDMPNLQSGNNISSSDDEDTNIDLAQNYLVC